MMRSSLFIVCPFLFCAANSFSSEFATKNLCCKGRVCRCFACAWRKGRFCRRFACACAVPFVILSVAKNPRFHFVDTSLTLSMTSPNDKQTLLLWLAFCRSALALSYRKMRFLALLCVCLRLRCATCHFERSEKSTLSFCGYFANAQYDKAFACRNECVRLL